MTEWDTFSLFQSLLDEFPECLAEAALLGAGNPEDDLYINIAMAGFSQFRPLTEWSQSQNQIIKHRLADDLAELDWFEYCAEAIKLFACLCLGAMLGKAAAGNIADAGFLLGDAHLAGFIQLHDRAICQHWQNLEKRNVR